MDPVATAIVAIGVARLTDDITNNLRKRRWRGFESDETPPPLDELVIRVKVLQDAIETILQSSRGVSPKVLAAVQLCGKMFDPLGILAKDQKKSLNPGRLERISEPFLRSVHFLQILLLDERVRAIDHDLTYGKAAKDLHAYQWTFIASVRHSGGDGIQGTVSDCLLDTGSDANFVATDTLRKLGILQQAEDIDPGEVESFALGSGPSQIRPTKRIRLIWRQHSASGVPGEEQTAQFLVGDELQNDIVVGRPYLQWYSQTKPPSKSLNAIRLVDNAIEDTDKAKKKRQQDDLIRAERQKKAAAEREQQRLVTPIAPSQPQPQPQPQRQNRPYSYAGSLFQAAFDALKVLFMAIPQEQAEEEEEEEEATTVTTDMPVASGAMPPPMP